MRKWFHVTFSTYGTWLPGDPRGFRTRRHKLHSSGNYKTPPPAGEHAGLQRLARRTMRARAVTLTALQRKQCTHAIIDKLTGKGCEVIAIAVGGEHVHIQMRAEDQELRRLIGLTKQCASHALCSQLPGTIWAAGCRTDPIRSRDHQKRLFHYIQQHRNKGAFVWTIHDNRGRSRLLRCPKDHRGRRSKTHDAR